MRLINLLTILIGLSASLVAWAGESAPADLVLQHGRVVTMNADQPQAEALAVRDRHIVAVGSDADIAPLIGKRTRVIDLDGRLAVPGFIEGHGHFMALGEAKTELDLTQARRWKDVLAMVAKVAKTVRPGEWILGRGWHQEKWDLPPNPNIDGLPLHASLDAVAPDNPVLLEHASGHAVFVNARALALAGIAADTPDPAGGEIVRDDKGRPIGMLRDNAMTPVYAVLDKVRAQRSRAEVEKAFRERVRLAAQDAVAKGITSFVDDGERFATVRQLKQLAGEGKLPLRLYVMINDEPIDALDKHLGEYKTLGYANDHFTVRAVGEIAADGALGTHSAWFMKPYSDQPNTTGVNVTSMPDIRRIAEIARREGFQLAVHAIGDRANHEVLDVYADVLDAHPEVRKLRWRIEHAQHLAPDDIPRFGKLGVTASMQSIHACSDGPYVVKRLGPTRAEQGAYIWHDLLASGALIANGTDVPVEDENPMPNFACAVSRRLADGSTFLPKQAMSRTQALRSYTLDNAWAIYQEDRLGSLAPGKLADIVVLSRDIMNVPVEKIAGTRVDYTIVGGDTVYAR